jgi:hypothetical protein
MESKLRRRRLGAAKAMQTPENALYMFDILLGGARASRSWAKSNVQVFINQAKATGGANRPPPNDPLARSVSKKNTMISFGSMPASPSFSTKAVTRRFFLSVSVPEDTNTSTTAGQCGVWVDQYSADVPGVHLVSTKGSVGKSHPLDIQQQHLPRGWPWKDNKFHCRIGLTSSSR